MRHSELTIDVVIPAHNAQRDIVACLAPLLGMRHRGEIARIIVVDDASTDATGGAATSAGADRVVEHGVCQGAGGARNSGVAVSNAAIIWFVDADVVVHDNGARVLARHLSDNKKVDALFGSYGLEPIADNFLSQYKNLIHHRTHQRHAGPAQTFWTGCGAVTRAAFDAIDGFDAVGYRDIGMEDVDFGYRLRAAGYVIELISDWQCEHRKRWTLFNLLRVEIFHRALPWSRLILTHPKAPAGLNVDGTERLRAGIAGLFVLGVLLVLIGLINAMWLAGVGGALAFLNRGLFQFFNEHRGWPFACRAVAFHQIYYLYAATTFLYAWAEDRGSRLARRFKRVRPV